MRLRQLFCLGSLSFKLDVQPSPAVQTIRWIRSNEYLPTLRAGEEEESQSGIRCWLLYIIEVVNLQAAMIGTGMIGENDETLQLHHFVRDYHYYLNCVPHICVALPSLLINLYICDV